MIPEIIFWLFSSLLLYLLGSRLISFFKLKLLWYERALFSFGLGAVAATLGVFYLGLLGLLYRWVFIALAALVLLLSVKEIKSWKKPPLRVKWDVNSFFFAALALLILANFVMSLAPVFGIDALNYHLPIAKFYAGQHAVAAMPGSIYSNLPHGLSMLYTVPELFGLNAQASTLLAATFSSLAALAAAALTHRFFSRKAAGFSAVMFATLPVYIEFASQPHVDLSVTFFSILAFYSLLALFNSDSLKWVVVFALFASSLALYRLTAAFMPFSFGLAFFVFLLLRFRSDVKSVVKHSLIAAVVMLLVAAPWFVWVYSNTGDPVYPFLSRITRDPVALELTGHMESLVVENSGFNSFNAKGVLKFLALPVLVTFSPVQFDSVLGITPFFLVFLPLFIFRAMPVEKRGFAGYAVLIFFISMFAWQFTNPGLRYLLPALALLMPPAAYSAFWVLKNSRYRLIMAAAILLALLFSAPVLAGIAAKRIPAALGLVSEESYLAGKEDANPIRAINFANSNLPSDARVMFFQETRTYYLDRAYFLSDTYMQQILDFNDFATASQLREGLLNLGITHILVGKTDLARDLTGNIAQREQLMDSLMQSHAKLIYEDSHHKLLELV